MIYIYIYICYLLFTSIYIAAIRFCSTVTITNCDLSIKKGNELLYIFLIWIISGRSRTQSKFYSTHNKGYLSFSHTHTHTHTRSVTLSITVHLKNKKPIYICAHSNQHTWPAFPSENDYSTRFVFLTFLIFFLFFPLLFLSTVGDFFTYLLNVKTL